MQADVVVIGAGALGLSTALHCALLGRPVIVVERDTAGSQASGRAAGLFKSVQGDALRTDQPQRHVFEQRRGPRMGEGNVFQFQHRFAGGQIDRREVNVEASPLGE